MYTGMTLPFVDREFKTNRMSPEYLLAKLVSIKRPGANVWPVFVLAFEKMLET
jgi:hypothetical protein